MTNTVVQLRCTDSDKDAWQRAAVAEEMLLSVWIRSKLNGALDEGERLEARSPVESFTEPVAVKPSPSPSVHGFAFKPDPKANVKPVRQAVQGSGVCSAFCPHGTKCKVCGKAH